ncbi:MAG TPA: flap endonuclease-1 [Candidatus Nanoarchaeia archaeon]|nr:flap endonuclease-1 [Candidatus Nanoarchaeia archaeon]
MGVNISSLLPIKEIKFEDLKNKVVGVDFFNVAYQFLSSIRGYDGTPLHDSHGQVTSHLQGILARSLNLMSKGIKLVYVVDGESPELKHMEVEERNARKNEAEAKYKEAKDKENLDEMYKYSKQFLRFEDNMIEESKELIEALGIPVVQAPSEAEGQIAYMNRNGDVWGCGSQDADSLLFGAPRLIRNLTLSQKRTVRGKTVYTFLELIELNEVLEKLQINHDQLIVLGVMIGTDFNKKGVPGVGPKKALKLIKDYKNEDEFDRLFNELKVEFDWREVYKIFKNLPVEEDYSLRWKSIDEDKVREILVDRHDFNWERVKSLINKHEEENKLNKQKGLGDFF